MNKKQYSVYILTNKSNTLYIGVTNNLQRRIYEHKNKLYIGFTSKYNISKLIFYEVYDNIENAILREKQLKGKTRKKKMEIIKKVNPEFKDLTEKIQ